MTTSQANVLQQAQALRQRIHALYRAAGPPEYQPEVLQRAFEELAAVEELMLALQEELHQARNALPMTIAEIDAQRQRYQDLFDGAPDGYIVTGMDGTIRMVNRTAMQLLGAESKQLVGRSLSLFLPSGERRVFRSQLRYLNTIDQQQRWEVRLTPMDGDSSLSELVVRVAGGRRPSQLRWRVTPIEERKRSEQDVERRSSQLEQWPALASPAQQDRAAPLPADWENRLPHMLRVLAEASALLAVASDDSCFNQIGCLLVSQLADVCTIDIAESGGAVRQLVVLRDPESSSQNVREFSCRYWSDQQVAQRWQQREDSAQVVPPVLDIGPASRAHDPALRPLLRRLNPRVALLIPLQTNDQLLGSLTIGMADESGCCSPLEKSLFQELARQMVAVLLRARVAASS